MCFNEIEILVAADVLSIEFGKSLSIFCASLIQFANPRLASRQLEINHVQAGRVGLWLNYIKC